MMRQRAFTLLEILLVVGLLGVGRTAVWLIGPYTVGYVIWWTCCGFCHFSEKPEGAGSEWRPDTNADLEPLIFRHVLHAESVVSITDTDMVNAFGIGPRQARQILESLAEQGRVERVHEGRRILYSIPDRAANSAEERAQGARGN